MHSLRIKFFNLFLFVLLASLQLSLTQQTAAITSDAAAASTPKHLTKQDFPAYKDWRKTLLEQHKRSKQQQVDNPQSLQNQLKRRRKRGKEGGNLPGGGPIEGLTRRDRYYRLRSAQRLNHTRHGDDKWTKENELITNVDLDDDTKDGDDDIFLRHEKKKDTSIAVKPASSPVVEPPSSDKLLKVQCQ